MSIHIDASPEKVWKVLADFPNVYLWAPDIKHSQATNEKTCGLGAGRSCHIPGFGATDEKIIEWNEGQSMQYDVRASGPVKIGRNRWSIRNDGSGSRVNVDFDGEMRFGMFGEFLGSIMVRPMMMRIMDRSLNGLKQYVEKSR